MGETFVASMEATGPVKPLLEAFSGKQIIAFLTFWPKKSGKASKLRHKVAIQKDAHGDKEFNALNFSPRELIYAEIYWFKGDSLSCSLFRKFLDFSRDLFPGRLKHSGSQPPCLHRRLVIAAFWHLTGLT